MWNPVSVVGRGWVHDKRVGAASGNRGEADRQTHYWALRQQARGLIALVVGAGPASPVGVVGSCCCPALVVGCGV